ncbi:Lupus La protein [Vairimorpha necatrix]|uniref:Lupus La protein n=1 Tax=Vairimorpha necatrix TaxID=6039 RepID=A0AAX4JAF7_9MICR
MSLDKVKKQVEFYFSDANFRVDAFMKQQSLINNGYIPIDTILTFKKMRELNADKELVIKSISDSNIVEYKDDCLKKIETEEFKNYICDNDIDSKCLFISGFNKDSKLEDIVKCLKDLNPRLIRMRKEKNKKFSGSVFVELKDEEAVNEALKMQIVSNYEVDTDESVKRSKSGDYYLTIMKKKDFLAEKDKITGDKKLTEAKKALKEDYASKLFRYEINKELDISEIKRIVKDTAFVDKNENVLRLKFAKDFDSKEYNEEDTTIKLRKLTKEEVFDYCDKIPIRPKQSKKKINKK